MRKIFPLCALGLLSAQNSFQSFCVKTKSIIFQNSVRGEQGYYSGILTGGRTGDAAIPFKKHAAKALNIV
jgi:hypothetical protein